MKKLRLDFKNRIVSIVSEQKTVIAYMDDSLRKKDFQTYFPNENDYDSTDNVTFDFENCFLCLKQPIISSIGPSGGRVSGYQCVKRIPMPAIDSERQKIMHTVGWNEG